VDLQARPEIAIDWLSMIAALSTKNTTRTRALPKDTISVMSLKVDWEEWPDWINQMVLT
jgi:hypothetical protein